MNKYFLIHGAYGNPYKNWFPWLKKELAKRGISCVVPSFPTPEKQDYDSWSKILKAYYEIDYINENTNFITHSLGGVFLVKFLIENHIQVGKIITVAGFNNLEFDDNMQKYLSFYLEEKEIRKIKKYVNERIAIYTDNDFYVPYEEAQKFANSIQAEKIVIKNAGHFNEKFGYTEFKEILHYIS